jgi:hypothetical protein
MRHFVNCDVAALEKLADLIAPALTVILVSQQHAGRVDGAGASR